MSLKRKPQPKPLGVCTSGLVSADMVSAMVSETLKHLERQRNWAVILHPADDNDPAVFRRLDNLIAVDRETRETLLVFSAGLEAMRSSLELVFGLMDPVWVFNVEDDPEQVISTYQQTYRENFLQHFGPAIFCQAGELLLYDNNEPRK